MKFSIFVFFLSLSIVSIAQANKPFDFQLAIGPSYTIPFKKDLSERGDMIDNMNFIGSDYYSGDITRYCNGDYGFFIDVDAIINIGDRFSMTSGIGYRRNSWDIYTRSNDHIWDLEYTSNYINIPLNLNYTISEYVPITITGGIYVGILLKTNAKLTMVSDTAAMGPNVSHYGPVTMSVEGSVSDSYKDLDFGVSGKLNYKFGLTEKSKGVILIGFDYGLINVRTPQDKSDISEDVWKNYRIYLGLGIEI